MPRTPATLGVVRAKRAAAGFGLLAAVVVLPACGGSESTYVEEPGSGLFLRLPADWEVFGVVDGDPAGDPRVDVDAGAWQVGFDGASRPDRSHLEETAPDAPVGTAEVVPLAGLQLPIAQATLRTLFTADGSDPLVDGGVDELEYDEVDLGSHWGNRLVGTVDVGGQEVRVAQLGFFDEGGKRLYLVRVLCSPDCFDDNEDEIEGVLDSLTLESR